MRDSHDILVPFLTTWKDGLSLSSVLLSFNETWPIPVTTLMSVWDHRSKDPSPFLRVCIFDDPLWITCFSLFWSLSHVYLLCRELLGPHLLLPCKVLDFVWPISPSTPERGNTITQGCKKRKKLPSLSVNLPKFRFTELVRTQIHSSEFDVTSLIFRVSRLTLSNHPSG